MKKMNATFGAGCFWCIEACFSELKGVLEVESGYSGGEIKNPAYREVCEGRTGHAEVIRIVYDEDVVSFEELLEMFWFVHDPTTLNRQGADVGTQYRSAIFYHSLEQKEIAERVKRDLDATEAWENPIVTEITAWKNFYPAGEDHEDFMKKNPDNRYCTLVVRPKYEKFKKAFAHKFSK